MDEFGKHHHSKSMERMPYLRNYGEQNSRTVDNYKKENVKVISQLIEILSRLLVWKLHKALLKKQLAKRQRE